jgi:hypothetical protein
MADPASDTAVLILQDGTQLQGKQFGACKSVSGEVGRAQFQLSYFLRVTCPLLI